VNPDHADDRARRSQRNVYPTQWIRPAVGTGIAIGTIIITVALTIHTAWAVKIDHQGSWTDLLLPLGATTASVLFLMYWRNQAP
jgi:hypothetical protein